MDYYVIGQDKTLEEAYTAAEVDAKLNASNVGALPLSGGNMRGNIGFQGSMSTQNVIRFLDNTDNTYGNGVSIGCGGPTIIGGGESAQQVEGVVTVGSSETLYLAADTVIEFYTNVQSGVNNATKVTLSTAGLLSGHQKAITYGTAAPSGGSNGDIYIQY